MFAAHGVRKVRLTGGEPLLRKNLEVLVGMLRELRTPDGEPLDLTLTTNGSVLARKAQALKDAGLRARDGQPGCARRRDLPAHERRRFPVADGARRHRRGAARRPRRRSRSTWSSSAAPTTTRSCRWRATSRARGVVLRFIEYMDVGATNGWRMDEVLPSAEVRARASAPSFPLEPIDASAAGETAQRWRYADGGGEIGVISSVTQAFCRDCNRARLSTEGKLFLCLFASRGPRPARAAARRLQRRADRRRRSA